VTRRRWEREQEGEYGELPSLQFVLLPLRGEQYKIFFLLIFSVFSVPPW